MLTFENIWVHSARPTVVSSSSNVAVSKDSQGMSRKNSTHSAVSNVLAQYQKQHQKWLAQIKRRILPNESVANKSIPAHKRALIVGASGTLLPGQVTVLTGPSGSGKSILLRVLAGLSSMDTGDVWQYDDPVQRSSSDCCIHTTPPTQWRAQVALLAQHPQLIEGSVLDNLQMPYRLQAYQQSYFDKDWHIEQLAYLERTADFLQQSANHLSGGERQLVNTLRLLQLAPQVLLLDEPTAALDPGTSAKLVQLIINWLRAEPQRTLLWVTHDTQDIMPLANNHWHMQAGVLTEIF
ncbi:putative ABC transport system ATP-binding protein [Psychrobacter sp. LV10R520-6]|nr:putative ABC transport system ATP-binding protein [Psychrobacter sp. LV10R520-6]